MKNISIIATGGTIASESGVGIKPTYQLNDMLKDVPEIHKIAHIRAHQLMNKDSTNIQPGDWVKIATSVFKELKYSDGIVITHGTDTMSYTSSALSFMLQNLGKPVIMTGSQRSWNEEGSDAKPNLINAVRVAASGTEKGIKGVHIVFHGKIIKGCRARKSKNLERVELDAFETVNFPLVGLINNEDMMLNPISALDAVNTRGGVKLDTRMGERVMMIVLTPGFDPTILDDIKGKCDAIIIQAYGLGDMPIRGRGTLIPVVKSWLDEGKIVAITSQACYETDLSVYEVGKKFLELGVIPTLDMTQESAYTKLMWVLGHTKKPERVKEMMWKNYAGEIWPLHSTNGYKRDIMAQMARYHDLTRILYESNTELMDVLRDIFKKTKQ